MELVFGILTVVLFTNSVHCSVCHDIYAEKFTDLLIVCAHNSTGHIYWNGPSGPYTNGTIVHTRLIDRVQLYNNNTSLSVLQIKNISIQDEGNYSCSFSKVQNEGICPKEIKFCVKLKRSPSSIGILNSVNNSVTGREGEILNLECKVESGLPPENMRWESNNQVLETGGPSMISLSFSPTKSDHLRDFTCLANNSRSDFISDHVKLIVNWKPIISINASSSEVAEGKNLTVICKVVSNPPASEVYLKSKGKMLTGELLSEEYVWRLTYMNRNQSGNYSCVARNIIGEHTIGILIDVKYPPSIEIEKNISDDGTITLNCNAKGSPSKYSFMMWEHVSFFGEHIRYLSGNNYGRLVLSKIVNETKLHQNSGRYICNVTNGIPAWETNELFQVKEILVTYTGVPVFLQRNVRTFFASFGKTLEIKFYLYSDSNITSQYVFNEKGQSIPICSRSSITRSDINDTFFGTMITIDGYTAKYQFDDTVADYFSSYTLNLTNLHGTSSYSFEIQSADAPEQPLIISAVPQTRSIKICWKRNFDGGYPQWFTVEMRPSTHNAWIQHRSINDSTTQYYSTIITGLQPEIVYEVRIFSENIEGRSNYSTILMVQTLKEDQPSMKHIIHGVIGIALSVMFVIVIFQIIRKFGFDCRCTQRRDRENNKYKCGVRGQDDNAVTNTLYDLEEPNENANNVHDGNTRSIETQAIAENWSAQLNYVQIFFGEQQSASASFIHSFTEKNIYSDVELVINLNESPKSDSSDDSSDDDFMDIEDIINYELPKQY